MPGITETAADCPARLPPTFGRRRAPHLFACRQIERVQSRRSVLVDGRRWRYKRLDRRPRGPIRRRPARCPCPGASATGFSRDYRDRTRRQSRLLSGDQNLLAARARSATPRRCRNRSRVLLLRGNSRPLGAAHDEIVLGLRLAGPHQPSAFEIESENRVAGVDVDIGVRIARWPHIPACVSRRWWASSTPPLPPVPSTAYRPCWSCTPWPDRERCSISRSVLPVEASSAETLPRNVQH